MSTNRKSIPIIKQLTEDVEFLSNVAKNIIVAETGYLKRTNKMLLKNERDEVKKETDKHNNVCDRYFREADFKIFKLLGLSSENVQQIYADLNSINIYDYNGNVNLKNY